MILGDNQYYKCPKCGSLISTISLLSGNTFGSIIFSDGFRIAHMLPDIPRFSRCFKCGTLFWLDEESRVEFVADKDYREAVGTLELEEYLVALEMGNYKTEEDEIYLRIRLWWAFNDRVRAGKPLFSSESDKADWQQNLEKLLKLLDSGYNEDIIMMVEIYRNLGDFKKSRDLLASLQNDTVYNFKELVKKFEKEIIKKNTLVFKL